eukprot:GEMP01118730.1.p1 GENE.GEMP01118730.1~~GEMP01118730.1.p1  ORF type:complete len:112 (+),score=7.12 GEMP01118730.1:226-561(+)
MVMTTGAFSPPRKDIFGAFQYHVRSVSFCFGADCSCAVFFSHTLNVGELKTPYTAIFYWSIKYFHSDLYNLFLLDLFFFSWTRKCVYLPKRDTALLVSASVGGGPPASEER